MKLTRKKRLEIIKLEVADNGKVTKHALDIWLQPPCIGRGAFNEACQKGYALHDRLKGRTTANVSFAEVDQ